ncbi:DNRLRE domain-containing protein [Candidatus Villigracilis affinis]|uniref:DNRLRE domain-containing protein n=1 Tax=Candidatus Villigracilis affinis TaxID=3140682 RepID=UPI001DF3F6CE|nr:DNRLRE domain-containing protein [Anaerolineales bacterium]
MTDGLGETTWSYDVLNRPLTITDSNNATIGYEYDAVGNRTELTYPNGNAVTYGYDSTNQLSSVTDWNNATTSYDYDDAGRLISVSRPNGVNSNYGYDAAGQITQLEHAFGTSSIASYSYNYDPAGNLVQAIENITQPVPPTPIPTFTETPSETPTETPTFTPTITDTPTETQTLTPTATSAPTTVYTLILQPNGSDGVDNYILKSSASTNYGTSADMGVGEKNNATNSVARSLVKFDLSSLPSDATILSATLSLWTSQDLSDNDTTVNVYRLKVPYNETQSNWNRSATGVTWQTAGASGANDHEGMSIGSMQLLANEPLNIEKQIPLDAAKIQELANGTFTNNGFFLSTSSELNDRFMFKSSDTSTASQRPKLVIEYTSPSTTPTPTAMPGFIFADGFESGNFSAWSEANTDGGDLFVSHEAAAIGNYGMEAFIDDISQIEVDDDRPNGATHYSARFYLNPNTVYMPNNNSMYVFVGDTDPDGWAFCLGMKRMADYYSLAMCGLDDTNQWLDGKEIYISDEWQAVEMEWKAATTSGANDGYMKLWINGVLVDTISNIDSDASRITDVSLGFDSDVSASSSGSVYFDAFESRQGQYIGLAPNGPVLSPPNTDLLLKDNFEGNDFSLWRSNPLVGNGDLSISTNAAIAGAYGLQALINDTTAIYLVEDDFLFNEPQYHARFYFDPNSIAIPGNNAFSIFSGGNSTGTAFRIMLYGNGGTYKLQAQPRNDTTAYIQGQQITMADSPHLIEITFKASSAAGLSDGYFELWLDDMLVDTIVNLDNDTRKISYTELGATGSLDVGTNGTIYFDEFESRRTAHIGAASGIPLPSATPTATPTNTSDPNITHLNIPIVSNNDDAEEDTTGWVNRTSSDLELVHDADNQQVGMRFTGVNIPQGATILNAYIQFTVDETTSSEATSLIIQAEANDNPITFGSANKVSTRPRTTASVAWEPLPWLTAGESGVNQRTPDLASIIQETVNRTGWTSNNAIAFIITGTGHRVAVAYDGSASGAPHLYIEYIMTAATTEPTLTETTPPTLTSTPAETSTPTQIGAVLPSGGGGALFAMLPLQLDLTATPTLTPDLLIPDTLTPTSIPLPSATIQPSGPLTINYTYDALHRLTAANYSDSRNFAYTYDANGNTLTASDPTATTAYTYDAANQLVTAQADATIWHYEYDANGSLVEVLPDGNAASGAKRYTYNTAGYLTEVESHNGSGWNSQAEMTYNGFGTRMTSSAFGVTTQYVSDGQMPLTITSTDKTTTVLYGLGPIAEQTAEWNYVLNDGVNIPRQLTDIGGDVTMSVRYNPWGKPLETSGTGNFDASYIGTLIDATTGLIYIGNGQYYDPETGRFLTRGVNPNRTNPYVPWNPIGAVFGPLVLTSIYYSRKKGKKSPWLALIFLGLFLAGCYCPIPGTPWSAPEVPNGVEDNSGSGTVTPDPTQTQPPTEIPITPAPCTDCSTSTPTPTPAPIPNETEIAATIEELVSYIIENNTKSPDYARVRNYLRWLMDESGRQNLNTNHLAYIYATSHIESKWIDFTEQYDGDPREYFKRYDGILGNVYEGDGERYMGRGFIHLTGRENYRNASKSLGLWVTDANGTSLPKLEEYPFYAQCGADTSGCDGYDYVTNVAVKGMAGGWFTGKKLSDYDNADGSYGFYDARTIINWPGATPDATEKAKNLGIGFAEILGRQCPLGGTSTGIVCRPVP